MLVSHNGLMYVSHAEQDDEQFFTAIERRFNVKREQCFYDEQKLIPYVEQFIQFEKGQTPASLNYDLRGTSFQQQVWEALLSIPYGETTYYSAIAARIGNPKAVRAVGRAIGANPILIVVPCHRVVGKDGSLTGFSAGLHLKQLLLAHEQA